MKPILLLFLLVLSPQTRAAICIDNSEEYNLAENMSKILDFLDEDILSIKIKYDKTGKLSVTYNEKGEPALLRFRYGDIDASLSMDQIAKGETFSYKDDDGKVAMSVERVLPFRQGDRYQFQLKLRKSKNPDTFTSFPVVMDSKSNKTTVLYEDKPVTKVSITPGVKFFSWNGTFNSASFSL